MRKLIFLAVILTFVISSCSDDESYNDFVSIVTVVESSTTEKLFMRSDSSQMRPLNFNITSNPGQRMLIEYEIINTYSDNAPYRYDIFIEDFNTVLTKNIIDLTAENEVEVGNDAFWDILFVNYSVGYINIYLSFLYNYNPHFINLVNNSVEPPLNRPDSINLELRQNANGDNVGFPVAELVSFNVQEYLDAAELAEVDMLTFAIKVMLPSAKERIFYLRLNPKTRDVTMVNYNSLEGYSPENSY